VRGGRGVRAAIDAGREGGIRRKGRGKGEGGGNLGDLLEDFDADGSRPGHDLGVVVAVDILHSLVLGVGEREILGEQEGLGSLR
jgi:hypothetical protein